MDINTSDMSEKEFSNLIKQLLSNRYAESKQIDVSLWSYDKNLDKLKLYQSMNFK